MARKRAGEPPPDQQPADGATTTTTSHGESNGDARKPAMSWALNSDRTTRLEVAAWLNTHTAQGGEQFEQVSLTISRSYKTDDGWHKGGSWRTHDVPVLQHLLAEAHAWALRRRTTVKADGEEVPF